MLIFEYQLVVAATNGADGLASFSNFGGEEPYERVQMSAPGEEILTTMLGGGYGYVDGTSFSSPLTAGAAALVLATHPALVGNAAGLKAQLINWADVDTNLRPGAVVGSKRLNVGAAVSH